jgi:hypothetical protein
VHPENNYQFNRGAGVRTIATNLYSIQTIEYKPTSGPAHALPNMDPLQLGHYKLDGTTQPQGWYEYGHTVGIEPLPDAVYPLRLFIMDISRLIIEPEWTVDWTPGARWVVGDTAIHTGASSDITYKTPVTNGGNYTLEFQVTAIDPAATLLITGGSVEGALIPDARWHMQNIIPNGITLKLTAVGDLTIGALTIYKEGEISAGTDRFDLGPEWNHSLALYATYNGLLKDRRQDAAIMLMSMYSGEFDYMFTNVVAMSPDVAKAMTYK